MNLEDKVMTEDTRPEKPSLVRKAALLLGIIVVSLPLYYFMSITFQPKPIQPVPLTDLKLTDLVPPSIKDDKPSLSMNYQQALKDFKNNPSPQQLFRVLKLRRGRTIAILVGLIVGILEFAVTAILLFDFFKSSTVPIEGGDHFVPDPSPDIDPPAESNAFDILGHQVSKPVVYIVCIIMGIALCIGTGICLKLCFRDRPEVISSLKDKMTAFFKANPPIVNETVEDSDSDETDDGTEHTNFMEGNSELLRLARNANVALESFWSSQSARARAGAKKSTNCIISTCGKCIVDAFDILRLRENQMLPGASLKYSDARHLIFHGDVKEKSINKKEILILNDKFYNLTELNLAFYLSHHPKYTFIVTKDKQGKIFYNEDENYKWLDKVEGNFCVSLGEDIEGNERWHPSENSLYALTVNEKNFKRLNESEKEALENLFSKITGLSFSYTHMN